MGIYYISQQNEHIEKWLVDSLKSEKIKNDEINFFLAHYYIGCIIVESNFLEGRINTLIASYYSSTEERFRFVTNESIITDLLSDSRKITLSNKFILINKIIERLKNNKIEKVKFEKFLKIRNLVAHNMIARDFENANIDIMNSSTWSTLGNAQEIRKEFKVEYNKIFRVLERLKENFIKKDMESFSEHFYS